uniref:C2H2-type domain-containing protein n=1 Tax=Chaetoceros debilis TaxID=122233 RepID=A0A7S3QJX4_9STRA
MLRTISIACVTLFLTLFNSAIEKVQGLYLYPSSGATAAPSLLRTREFRHSFRSNPQQKLLWLQKLSSSTTTTSTILHATTETSTLTQLESVIHKCDFCAEEFASRNALFRHISQCTNEMKENGELGIAANLRRYTLGFRFAYFSNSSDLPKPEAKVAGEEIQNAFKEAMRQRSSKNIGANIEILSCTQATIAKQRHRSLSQEFGCSAVNDVITIRFACSPSSFGEKEYAYLLKEMNIILKKIDMINIQLINVSSTLSKFHAENSCTQFVYKYMLPLKWIKDGKELERWWLFSENKDVGEAEHPGTFQSQPPSTSLKTLSKALKSAESITVPNRRVRKRLLHSRPDKISSDRKIEKTATRRLGTLSNKERRAWHNFADPALQGDASPNQEPVWKVLDRARLSQIIKNPLSNEVVAVIEFRGDGFMPQQIRRIVGVAVAITNGLLPSNFFEVATKPQNALGTILAPGGRLYLSDAKYHYDQSIKLFYGSEDTSKRDVQEFSVEENEIWLQNQIFLETSKAKLVHLEDKWLKEMNEIIAPRVSSEMFLVDQHLKVTDSKEYISLSTASDEYSSTLSLLQNIALSGWPKTSIARSKVLRHKDGCEEFGSFTIINPELFSSSTVPLGNNLFPDLVQSVFDLEKYVSTQSLNNCAHKNCVAGRKLSTHCAVNFNASFTPHVDSGIGLGQSLSLIVGLGDYHGGDIFVEGIAYPIRYQPLEFDGWKQRHWTGAYSGERFSLVWFSPAH